MPRNNGNTGIDAGSVLTELEIEAKEAGLTRGQMLSALRVIRGGMLKDLYHLSLFKNHCIESGKALPEVQQ